MKEYKNSKNNLSEIKELEIKRPKEDLEDLEIYINEFFNFLPLAICTLNPLNIVINVSRAFSELTGYSEIEIIGQDIGKLFLNKKEAELLKKTVLKIGKTHIKETVILAKNKDKILAEIYGSLRKDREGNTIGYFLAILDIREVKQFREKLEEKVGERTKELEDSRKALTNILEDVAEARKAAEDEKNKTVAIIKNLSDGLLVFDEANTISFINPQAEKILNIKSQELTRKSIVEISEYENLKPLIKVLSGGPESLFRREMSLRENLIVSVSIIPIIREERKTGKLIILHDITREKMIEKMKTEFVSLTAHQLRTPLSAIKWTLQMLLAGDLGQITDEQRDFIEKTYKSNERMIMLINDLLNVTRIEEGRYLYKITLVSMEDLIRKVIDTLKEDIQKKEIKFKFRKPYKKLPKINVDVEKITLAVNNLINNAVQYTPPNGEVIVSLRQANHDIEFSVRDTGIGIPKEQQIRVFSKFFRGTNAVKTDTDGTGLGLYITKNIIEAHDGGIWFESEENKGSTFYFILPIKEEFKEFLEGF